MKRLVLALILLCVLSSVSHAQSRLISSMSAEGLLISTNAISDNPDESSEYDVLGHQEKAMNVLLGWSAASVVAGSAMLFHESRTVRDFGIQNIAWGVIDGGIALYARYSASRKRNSDISIQKERDSFRKLLLINSLLDIAYVGVGTAMAASGRDNLKGHGYGIIVQGAFLLIFDGINLLLIPEANK